MTTSFSFYANPSALEQTIVGRSGTSYNADASGIIHNVLPQDFVDVSQSGAKLIPALQNVPWVTGRFYGIPKGAALGTLLTVLGTIYATPIIVPNGMLLKSLNISVATGQTGGQVRAAIYSDYDGLPQNILPGTDTGNIAATGTAIGTSALVAGTFLPPGTHWLGVQATASSTMPTIEGVTAVAGSELSNQLGYDTAAHALAGSAEYTTGVTATGQTYGAMPLVFPTATLAVNVVSPAVAVGV